jgi:hypothetical protein
MDFTSSCTEETAASVVSTGVAVTSVTGAATVVAGAVVTPVVAAFLPLVVFAVSVTGAATTGVVATGAAGVVVAVFLETGLAVLEEAEVFIILEAVEEFMAGIRTIKKCVESIFDPTFIFGRVVIFFSNSSYSEPLNEGYLRVLFYLIFNSFRRVSRDVLPSTTLYEYKK